MDEPKDFTFDSDKNELRRILKERRFKIADKPILDAKITARASVLVCGNVMIYVSIGSEICTHDLIKTLLKRKDVKLYAPYTTDSRMTPLRLIVYNGEQPDNHGNLPKHCYGKTDGGACCNLPLKLDYCITPLLGFNRDGYRIGYGKGCYDRFFAQNQTVKVGLAYENSSVSFLPDIYDVPLDCCVTEQKVIYF